MGIFRGFHTTQFGAGLVALAYLSGCTDPIITSVPVSRSTTLDSGAVYALPKGEIKVTLSRASNVLSFSTTSIYSADRLHRYHLKFLPIATSADTLKVEIDSNGLLSSSSAASEDKTGEIIKEIGDLKTLLTGQGIANVSDQKFIDFSTVQVIDPFDQTSIRSFNAYLDSLNQDLKLVVSDSSSFSSSSAITSMGAQDSDNKTDCTSSYCFRVPMTVYVGLRQASGAGPVLLSTSVVLPDPSLLFGLETRRTPCIPKTTTVAFTNGMLTKSELTKPSEALACLGVPAKAILALIGIGTK